MQKHHTDPNIRSLFEAALLYLYGQENHIPTWADQSLHSGILQVGWPYILLRLLPVRLIRTQQLYYLYIGSRWTVSKLRRLLIQQLSKLLQGQWTYRSQLKHNSKALDNITKSTLLHAELTIQQQEVVEQLPPRYKSSFEYNLYSILEKTPPAEKNGNDSSKQHVKQQNPINTSYSLLPNH